MGLFNKGSKSNYLIVCHTWHVHSISWDSEILVNVTNREAQAAASLMADRIRGSCRAADARAYRLPDMIYVVNQPVSSMGEVES